MKVFLITGASSDIGCEFIRRLEEKKEECVVIGQYNSVNVADKIGCDLKYVNLKPMQCDFSDMPQVEEFANRIANLEDNITHIFHLAAPKLSYKKLKNYSNSEIIKSFNIQVNSIGEILKFVLPKMKKQGIGKIVFMLSSCTLGLPPKYLSEYTTVKYALLGLMKSLAAEYSGCGININAVSPNMVETQFLSGIDSRIVEMTASASTMKRNVEIDEVISAVEYLFSDNAAYLQSLNLNMTGGDRV